MKQALLARHAESEFSVRGLTNGDPGIDVALTEQGRAQARHLGEQLAGTEIDLAVTSEFHRARETAELALGEREVPRLVLPELNDIRFGEFEGRLLEDYRAWARAHGPEDEVPGGESRAESVRRYTAGFREILVRPERTILVVAHSLPIRYVLNAADGGLPAPAMEQVPYAQAFPLSAAQLTEAVERLETWTLAPVWTR
ncbi:MAG TPA: histidine phosphatase family protein [Gaiellaceae bacterium]